ncbi:Transcriptional regulatory protein YdfI [Nymphon striatum]|nr:Transcriptional regulatory protein YdfI [Nymphon striatum]
MPEMTGIELARRVWQSKPLTRIVLWSHYSDEIYLRSLHKIIPAETVYGYILKNKSSDCILKAVSAVFQEAQCWIDPDVRPVQARSLEQPSLITDAEFEVLMDIALGMTDNLIAQRRFLSRRGVQNRLKSLYMKLGVDNMSFEDEKALNSRSRAITISLQRGLINAHELQKEESLLKEWSFMDFVFGNLPDDICKEDMKNLTDLYKPSQIRFLKNSHANHSSYECVVSLDVKGSITGNIIEKYFNNYYFNGTKISVHRWESFDTIYRPNISYFRCIKKCNVFT